jgi:hypothetical protein
MRTPLEIASELDALLKRSKPFRNFNEVFNLTEQLITSLSPSTTTKKPEPVVEEVVAVETVEKNVEEVVETKVVKKTTKK